MKYNEILKHIRMLSISQGFYRSLLRRIETMSKGNLKALKNIVELQNFKDIFEMCEYFERLQLQ